VSEMRPLLNDGLAVFVWDCDYGTWYETFWEHDMESVSRVGEGLKESINSSCTP